MVKRKILCFIDCLGSGGAQRQITNLAIGLKQKGYDVSFLVYHNINFYESIISENKIPIKVIDSRSMILKFLKCRNYIRSGGFDVIISFLETPVLISEISTFPFKRWKLIVGERSAAPRILNTMRGRFIRLFHLFSDCVVSNCNATRDMVRGANPFLREKKNITIYNLYDLRRLSSCNYQKSNSADKKFHILIAASHQRLKNFRNLAVAITLLEESYKNKLCIDWYGSQNSDCFEENLNIVNTLNLKGIINFYPPTLNIYQKMVDCDAVGLFSHYEGLPNTICEAMCLGKPIIATNVSDNKELLENTNLISESHNPSSIAHTIRYLLDLSEEDLKSIGRFNRSKAESLFSKDLIVHKYEELFY